MKNFQSIKARLYPTQAQKILLQREMDGARFVYNWMLGNQKSRFETGAPKLSKFDSFSLIPHLKKEYPWLKDNMVHTLRYSICNLERAYSNFFNKIASFPKFKTRKEGRSFTYASNLTICNNHIHVAGVGKVKIKIYKDIRLLKWATVSLSRSGKYYIGLLYEIEIPKIIIPEKTLGLDDGIVNFLTLSTGKKIKKKSYQNNLKRQQRKLARKKVGSKRREGQRIKVAKIFEKIAGARKFQHHHLAWRILTKAVREKQAIVYQKSDRKGMIEKGFRSLSRELNNCGHGGFFVILEQKAKRIGVTVLAVDKFEATTKTCNVCKATRELSLNDRTWKCECGKIHDRDVNAAINIKNLGEQMLSKSVGTTDSVRGGLVHRNPVEAQSTVRCG